MYVHAKSLQSCPTLCDPMDFSCSGSSVHGILQARILEWVAMTSSLRSSWPGDQTQVSYVSALAAGFFTPSATLEALKPKRSPQLRSCLYFCQGPGHLTRAPPNSLWCGNFTHILSKTKRNQTLAYSGFIFISLTCQLFLFTWVPSSGWAHVTISPLLNNGLCFGRFAVPVLVFVCFSALWLSL